MNTINNFLNFYSDRKRLMKIQDNNDSKLKNLNCKDVLAMFLLFEREITRRQIDEITNSNIIKMVNQMNEINKINENNLNYINNLLEKSNQIEICRKLELFYKNKIKNYKDLDF